MHHRLFRLINRRYYYLQSIYLTEQVNMTMTAMTQHHTYDPYEV